MAEIPIHNRVEHVMESGTIKSFNRPYLGYSSLNDPCPRKLWYGFRWVKAREFSKRVQRIFDRGDIEEARVITDLKAAGMYCYAIIDNKEVEITGAVGEKQEEVIGVAGHVQGHPDGRVRNVPGAEKTPHLLEIKTMKDSKFKQYKKLGLEKAFPNYWGQIHSYMGKLGLKRCLYVVTNKDNEERSYERYKFDENVFKDLEAVAFDILATEIPPPKISELPTWFECKFCEFKDICHKGDEVLSNCRTCKNSCIGDFGTWSCDLTGELLTKQEQYAGCRNWQKLDGL